MPRRAFFVETNLTGIITRTFNGFLLWVQDNRIRAIIFIFVAFVIFPPLISYFQQLLKQIPYYLIFQNTVSFFQDNFTVVDYIFLALLIFILAWLLIAYKQLQKTKIIKENFDDEAMNAWSIPSDSVWTTERCNDAPGKMLSVSNSYFPGILKAAYGWYDYEISFQAKMASDIPDERQNISIVIRSENSLNGIMFQISKSNFNPYLIYNETFILDIDNSSRLRTVLRPDVWIPVKVIVRGNSVDISVDNYHTEYRIPTKVYNTVDSKLLTRNSFPTLRDIEESNQSIQHMQSEILEKARRIDSMQDDEMKKSAWAEVSSDIAKVPQSTRVILEYQKGSIGFRQQDVEHTYFRNLTVKKI